MLFFFKSFRASPVLATSPTIVSLSLGAILLFIRRSSIMRLDVAKWQRISD